MNNGIDCKGREWVERELSKTKKNVQDYTGQNFFLLTVIKPVYFNNKTAGWLLRCKCGNEIVIKTYDLQRYHSCGCYKKTLPQLKKSPDLTGQKFHYLTVLEKNKEDNRYGKTHWTCQCKCGKIISVATSSLLSGHTLSCGCFQKERMSELKKFNLLGQRFGKITVIDKALSKKDGNAMWVCKCDCGTIWEVCTTNLLSGATQSCGCVLSHGERNIKEVLLQNHICFKSQFTFKDLYDTNQRCKLRFDFAIFENETQEVPIRLIEFDGPQHNKSQEYFGGEKEYNKCVKHDFMKNQYALLHNIPLVRIPYKMRDKITVEILFNDTYLIQNSLYSVKDKNN